MHMAAAWAPGVTEQSVPPPRAWQPNLRPAEDLERHARHARASLSSVPPPGWHGSQAVPGSVHRRDRCGSGAGARAGDGGGGGTAGDGGSSTAVGAAGPLARDTRITAAGGSGGGGDTGGGGGGDDDLVVLGDDDDV